jgi:hypothetical protein
MVMKNKTKVTKTLFAATFLIAIFALVSTVNACGSNRAYFMAIGDDMDLNANDLIIGKINYGDGSEPPSVKVVFNQRIYDDSGNKVYAMRGMLKEGLLVQTDYYFLCPIFQVWFINVWLALGEGIYKTTDTDLDLIYRTVFPITMPNTEGQYVSAPMLMMLSTTAEYCVYDPTVIPPGPENPVETLPEGEWALVGVLCGIIVQTPFGPVELPIGPAAFLTRSWGL